MKTQFEIVGNIICGFIVSVLGGARSVFGKNRGKVNWVLYPHKGETKDFVDLRPNPMLGYMVFNNRFPLLLTVTPYSDPKKPKTFLFELTLAVQKKPLEFEAIVTHVIKFDFFSGPMRLQIESHFHEHKIGNEDPCANSERIHNFFVCMRELVKILKTSPELSAST